MQLSGSGSWDISSRNYTPRYHSLLFQVFFIYFNFFFFNYMHFKMTNFKGWRIAGGSANFQSLSNCQMIDFWKMFSNCCEHLAKVNIFKLLWRTFFYFLIFSFTETLSNYSSHCFFPTFDSKWGFKKIYDKFFSL